jgi:hypothetical protein
MQEPWRHFVKILKTGVDKLHIKPSELAKDESIKTISHWLMNVYPVEMG